MVTDLVRATTGTQEGEAMSPITQTRESAAESKTHSGLTLKVPDGARILIVCDDDSDTERLKTILREAGFVSEWAKSMTAAWMVAISRPFLAVFSTPPLTNESWQR